MLEEVFTPALKGYDLLGLAHPKWPLAKTIKIIPEDSAIGCFDDPFGDVLPALRVMLSTKAYPVVRIHAHWGGVSHGIIPVSKLKEKLPNYEKLARKFPNTVIYISHSCEYDEPDLGAVIKRVDLIRQMAPSCVPVNSCFRGATMESIITERHGRVKGEKGIISMDGHDMFIDLTPKRWARANPDAIIQFAWGVPFNFREYGDRRPPSPLERPKELGPSADYLRRMVKNWHSI